MGHVYGQTCSSIQVSESNVMTDIIVGIIITTTYYDI